MKEWRKKKMDISNSYISPEAKIGENVKIGPFCYIEDYAEIGDNTIIGPNTFIGKHTKIGKNNRIYNNVSLGSHPQDLKFQNEKTQLIIGDNNVIREFVTMNRACGEGEKTVVGSDCFIMAYSHIAHNCTLGNGVIMANLATLAGHVKIGNYVVIGGLAGIHQFVKVGDYAMIGGKSKIVKDVLPFSLVDGHPSRIFGLNLVGLKRRGFSKDRIEDIKDAYKIILDQTPTIKEAISILQDKYSHNEDILLLIDFLKKS
jgi:UDP-N-acetylglucosamine acyltransferase